MMTRSSAISLAFQIKQNPIGHDFSAYLYEAVGLIKREPGPGTAFAAYKLVEAIREVCHNPSDFCRRKMDIIEDAYIKAMSKNLETLAYCQEKLDYDWQMRMLNGV